MTPLPPVLLVDDSADDRELIGLVLAGAFGAVEIEEAADAAALARAMSGGRFGIVLTEHELPWIRAVDVVRLVRDLRPGCPVVVVTGRPIERAASELLHVAPDGLVPKTSAGLAGLPGALRAALAGSRRAKGELEEMVYAVSHDLRKPLNQVVRFLELLAAEAGGRLGREQRELLEQARASAGRLDAMFEAVLRCARIEGRAQELAPVDLDAVLERVLAGAAEEIAAAGMRVSHDRLPSVVADEAQIEQLFRNLVDNAIKYRGSGPEPRLEVEAEAEAGAWHLRFRDHGIGLDPADAERVFGMFQRLHAADEIPGSGIGLALCRRIVARHGGRIWVEARPGDGATFHVTLPRRAPVPPAPAGEEARWASRTS